MHPRTPQHRSLWRNQAGIAVTEFALVLPLLIMLFYGLVEITRYILITQKVEKLAHAVADMTAQSKTANIASLNQVMAAASDVMQPYSLTSNGHIIVSSLYQPAGSTPSVNWVYKGGGGLVAASHLGAIGDTPAMPAGFVFEDSENVIAAEVFYQFSPLISDQFFGTTTVYRVAFYKPRLGTLLSPPA